MLKFRKIGVLNTVAASAANVKSDGSDVVICLDNTANPLVSVLPRIPKGKIVNINYQASQAESRRIHSIGHNGEETVVANQRYRLILDHYESKYESAARGQERRYAYKAPATLSGVAATDRSNLYTDLYNKINNDWANFVTAYLLTKITVTAAAGDLNEVAVGGWIFQTDSTFAAATWKAQIAAVPTTAWSGATTIYVYNESGTLDSATDKALKVVTGTPEDISTDAANTRVAGQGIVLVDDAGYFKSPNELRPGKSVAFDQGFTTASIEKTLDGAYSIGIGTDMLAEKASYNLRKNKAITGDVDFTFDIDPVAGQTYELAVITVVTEQITGESNVESRVFEYHLYMDETTAQNVTDLKAALNAL